MGAVPKNKITRAERGKRRHGNRPFLLKDANTSVPPHKRGFVAELLKFVGLDSSIPDTALVVDDKTEKIEKVTTKTAPQANAALTDRKSQKNAALASKTSAKIVAPRTTSK